jgi:lipopolysaccharide transport system ATP-binding protein
VLAVGDYEFQKKCLGKMREVSQAQGRTILFVSHNMTAIRSLCKTGLQLHNGAVARHGEINDVVDNYLSVEKPSLMEEWGMKDAPGTEEAKLLYAGIDNVTGVLFIDEPFSITFKIWLNIQSPDRLRKINFSLVVSTLDGQVAFNVGSKAIYAKQPFIQTTCHIPPNFLNDEF